MTSNQIIILCSCIVGGIILIFLCIYLIGNVYRGLLKRYNLVIHSFSELRKIIDENFHYIPFILQNVDLSKNNADKLRNLYIFYSDITNDENEPIDLKESTREYINLIEDLSIKYKNDEFINFVFDHCRRLSFAVNLYNSRVYDYLAFCNLPINKVLRKIYNFPENVVIFEK